MKKPPCIRGLRAFKSGCPEKAWNGEQGCPAWIVKAMPKKDNPLQLEPVSACIDIWQFRLQFDACGLLEGNQQAVESFRNGMTTTDDAGRTVPRPDPAMVSFLGMMAEHAAKATPVQVEFCDRTMIGMK